MTQQRERERADRERDGVLNAEVGGQLERPRVVRGRAGETGGAGERGERREDDRGPTAVERLRELQAGSARASSRGRLRL